MSVCDVRFDPSLPPVSVTVVSVKRATLMSLCPLISIMHRLTAVGFILTATSLRAFGINSKCCDPSRQLVEQTATAHRAEQAVSGESQLTLGLHDYLHGLFICAAPSLKDKKHCPCFLSDRFSLSLSSHKHAAFRRQCC